jgi:hypothetical protein
MRPDVNCRERDPLHRPFPMSGQEAATYGAIVTFENAVGERLAVHRSGSKRIAVEQACAVATGYDSSFRIISISTPETIYTDLQGARLARPNQNGSAVPFPETRMARTFPGGMGMLHDCLRGSSDRRRT